MSSVRRLPRSAVHLGTELFSLTARTEEANGGIDGRGRSGDWSAMLGKASRRSRGAPRARRERQRWAPWLTHWWLARAAPVAWPSPRIPTPLVQAATRCQASSHRLVASGGQVAPASLAVSCTSNRQCSSAAPCIYRNDSVKNAALRCTLRTCHGAAVCVVQCSHLTAPLGRTWFRSQPTAGLISVTRIRKGHSASLAGTTLSSTRQCDVAASRRCDRAASRWSAVTS